MATVKFEQHISSFFRINFLKYQQCSISWHYQKELVKVNKNILVKLYFVLNLFKILPSMLTEHIYIIQNIYILAVFIYVSVESTIYVIQFRNECINNVLVW